jgi:hypothetical protein
VAAFGAIVFGGFDVHSAPVVLERLSDAGGATADFAILFRWVFIAAASFLAAAFLAVLCIVERPLRGPSVRPQSAPAAAQ